MNLLVANRQFAQGKLPDPSPGVGDVVIRDYRRDGVRRFAFRSVPGPEQYSVGSRHEALSQGTRFARRLQVRLWLADDDGFTLMEDYRAAGCDARRGGDR